MDKSILQGGLGLAATFTSLVYLRTGVGPLRQLVRAADCLRAVGYMAVCVGREARVTWRKDWESCLARARREW